MMLRYFLFLFLPLLSHAQGNLSGSGLGSPADEQFPRLSPDGRTLYYTVANDPSNPNGKRDAGDIRARILTETGWSEAVPQSQWNNSAWNAVIGFSPDGSEVYLSGHYSNDGQAANSQGISVSRKTDTGWSRPENIYIPYFINRSNGTGLWLNANADVMVYAAATPLSGGAEDLYITRLGTEGWEEPRSLGAIVNSGFQELAPSLSADGKKLYFSSNRSGGKGSFDVYESERLDDSWLSWSAPKPAMEGVFNTPGRELSPSPSPYGLWYTSTQDSDGYGDIRFKPSSDSVKLPQVVVNPGPPQRKEVEVTPSVASGNRVVTGVVTDANSKTGLPARIQVRGATAAVTADDKGRYRLTLPTDAPAILEIEHQGYIGVIRNVEKGTQEAVLDISLRAVEVGAVVNLPSVLFRQSSSILLPASYDELDMVVNFMKTNPSVRIGLAGHTDGRGNPRLNRKLSRDRVDRVKEYLVSKGVSDKRIQGKGFGGTKPVADNNTEAGRKLNRRVEFSILSK